MKHYIIPIFIPHFGCSHQCVFCNQRKITGIETPVTDDKVRDIILQHLNNITEPRYIEVAFYGGSFTALPIETQTKLLKPAQQVLLEGKIQAIRLSTRPDCITDNIIDNLKSMGVSTIELGVQSMDDKVLLAAERGHTSEVVYKAAELIKKNNINLGIQVMLGLPEEDWVSIIGTTKKVISLKPQVARIYPTLVITDTSLATLYQSGAYKPLTLDEAVTRAAYIKAEFEQNEIQVIRTGLQATEELGDKQVVLAGPYHPSFGEMVDSYIYFVMLARFLEQIFSSNYLFCNETIFIHHHIKDQSKIRGQRNINTIKLQDRYPKKNFVFRPDGVTCGEFFVVIDDIRYIISRKMFAV